jgi:hypothetical protein
VLGVMIPNRASDVSTPVLPTHLPSPETKEPWEGAFGHPHPALLGVQEEHPRLFVVEFPGADRRAIGTLSSPDTCDHVPDVGLLPSKELAPACTISISPGWT